MPRKIHQLVADLEGAGFAHCSTNGSHRKFRHAKGITVILSGQSGSDAHHYQEKNVRKAVAAAKEAES
jgi:predicted RNA binding protein YcfA (HicA-like mRNA interferase family)